MMTIMNDLRLPSHSLPIYRVAELRAIEQAGAGAESLMERAGAAAASDALALLPSRNASPLVVCGPGNNGGDGFVVARILKHHGMRPLVVFPGDLARLPADARDAYEGWRATGGEILSSIPGDTRFPLVVDAVFGIGLQRPLEGAWANLIRRINELSCPVLAIDIPSGLDADTGRVLGCAVRATHTSTFIALKPGLLTLEGPDHCGALSLHLLQLQPEKLVPSVGRTVARDLFGSALAPRRKNSHKGTMGSVAVVGGAPGMVGAALLAGRAALKLGTGRVYVGLLDPGALPVDPQQPELMIRDAGEVAESGLATALAAGPGLGTSLDALRLLNACVSSPLPLVLDADALNLVAEHPVLGRHLAQRAPPSLLTPHPAEAARLLACTTDEVQRNRIGAATGIARRFNAFTVLKGNGSVVATPDGRWFVNGSGNPGMASAGMGDVLTGLCAALLAQGIAPEPALLCGVHLHGAAADRLVGNGVGPAGLTASEVIDAARRVINNWTASSTAI